MYLQVKSAVACLVVFLALAAGLTLAGCKKQLTAQELRGQELYRTHCSDCHDQAPEGLLKTPPKLNTISRTGLLPDGAPASDANLHEVIVHGLRTMPAFNGRLKEEEIGSIIAWLHRME
jgi:mono/diheme cytochrome c family protein